MSTVSTVFYVLDGAGSSRTLASDTEGTSNKVLISEINTGDDGLRQFIGVNGSAAVIPSGIENFTRGESISVPAATNYVVATASTSRKFLWISNTSHVPFYVTLNGSNPYRNGVYVGHAILVAGSLFLDIKVPFQAVTIASPSPFTIYVTEA